MQSFKKDPPPQKKKPLHVMYVLLFYARAVNTVFKMKGMGIFFFKKKLFLLSSRLRKVFPFWLLWCGSCARQQQEILSKKKRGFFHGGGPPFSFPQASGSSKLFLLSLMAAVVLLLLRACRSTRIVLVVAIARCNVKRIVLLVFPPFSLAIQA